MFQALFPFDDWWVVPAKVAFDQTVWAAIWNSIYFAVLGILRFESPISIFTELKTTFLPMLTVSRQTNFHPQLFHEKTRILSYIKLCFLLWFNFQAGWKLWPFAHLVTYGVIPVEQRLLWVDCVELIWVTILSTYGF